MSGTDPGRAPRRPWWAGRLLVLLAIIALSLNLRPAAISVGPVLEEIRDGLGMSATVAGLLTALPAIAFAVFGALAPRLAVRLGAHRVVVLALVAIGLGAATRVLAGSVAGFLVLSLVALAGMAAANVVLPSLVKAHFPDRVGLVTALYTTALALGLTAASVLTVPAASALGDWRDGLAVWALLAVIAVVPWLALARRDRTRRREPAAGGRRIGLAAIARTRLGWWMALLFGMQSLQAYAIFGWFAVIYRDSGFSAATAGVLLGVITAVSIPMSLLVPMLTARMRDVRPLIVALCVCYPIGYIGLITAPVGGAWLWAVIVGAGTATFPMTLTLIGLRARTPEGTAALSGFTQAVGYLIAVVGPFAMGAVHDLTGGWTVPLSGLTVLIVPLLVAGLAVAAPRYVEDELDRSDLNDPSRGGLPR